MAGGLWKHRPFWFSGEDKGERMEKMNPESVSVDVPSYPGLGRVLAGDYYEDLPFETYISDSQPVPSGPDVYDIRDFGAVPGRGILNTKALQAAADACEKAGGGTVLVAGGSYCSGTITLHSGTTLFIAPDAEILASRNADLLIDPNPAMGTESSGGAFLCIQDASDVTVTGGGRISGNGEWYTYEPRKAPLFAPCDTVMLPRRDQAGQINTVPGSIRTAYRDRIRYAEDKYGEGKPHLRRPSYMVWAQNCRNLVFDNIILHDSMCWTLNVDCCDGVVIRNLVIDDNRHVANTDGIDLTGSSNVEISRCFVSCADDGLCLKNPVSTGRSMSHIRIRDCVVVSVMNAFKIGTGTRYDISDVCVENCIFTMPDLYPGSVSGISIESCDGSKVSDVTLRNLVMSNVTCPVYILLNRRNEAGDPYTEEVGANAYWGGGIRGIRIENIAASDVELPCIITGYADRKKDGSPVRQAVSDIAIANAVLKYREAGEKVTVPDPVPEFLTDYPESNAHGDVPACGFYVRHADRVSLENILVAPRKANTRETIVMEDVR